MKISKDIHLENIQYILNVFIFKLNYIIHYPAMQYHAYRFFCPSCVSSEVQENQDPTQIDFVFLDLMWHMFPHIE